MITPLEIQNKEFSKSFRGYSEGEVDEFLDKIIEGYEKITNENIEMKDKYKLLNEQLDKYNSMEKILKDTLVVAQSTAEEVVINANRKAELIIREAEERARKIIDNGNNEVLKINKEYENTKKEYLIFKTRFRTLLESQLDSVNEFLTDID